MICKTIVYRSKLVFRLHNSMAVSTFCAIVCKTNPHKFKNILTYTGIMLLTRLFKTIPATILILSQMCFISKLPLLLQNTTTHVSGISLAKSMSPTKFRHYKHTDLTGGISIIYTFNLSDM